MQAAAGLDDLGGSPGAHIRRGQHHLRPLILGHFGEPVAQRLGLFLATAAEWDIDIALLYVDPAEPGGVGRFPRHIAGTFPMADDPECLWPVLLLHDNGRPRYCLTRF